MIYIFYFFKKNQFWHQFQFHDYGSTYTTWTSVRLTTAKTIPSSKIRMCHGKNEVNPDGTPERDATNRTNGFFLNLHNEQGTSFKITGHNSLYQFMQIHH